MTSAIHPNPGGPTHAASPYKRKLAEIQRSLQAVLAVSPVHHWPFIESTIADIQRMIEEE